MYPMDNDVLVFKPQIAFGVDDASTYCSAKLVFDIGSLLVNMDDLDWVCAVGMIGDMATTQWSSFMASVKRRLGITCSDLFDSVLGRCAVVLSSAESYDSGNVAECYSVVYASSSPEQVVRSSLSKYEVAINKEVVRLLDAYHDKAEQHGSVVFYEVRPEYGVKAIVSNLLSLQHKNIFLVVADMNEDPVRFSARRQDREVPVNAVVASCAEGIGVAGGHIPAAGGSIPKKHWVEFKKRVVERVNSYEKGL